MRESPSANLFPREKTLKGKRKCKHPLTAIKSEEKRSVEAVKVFCQNTTRSETRCGDSVNRLSAALGRVKQVCHCTHLHDNCGKNPKGLTFTDSFYCCYLCEHFFCRSLIQLRKSILSLGILGFWLTLKTKLTL